MNKLIKILFLVNLLIFNKVIANPNINIKTGILMDYHSDSLFEIDSDLEIYPASMTKIMTSIIAFDLLKSGKLSMTDTFTISEMHGECPKQVIHQCLLWLMMKFP